MSITSIYKSHFIDVLSDYGGAIFFNRSNVLRIRNCLFQKCVANTEGAAIWCEGSLLALIRICADNCWIINPVNDNYGNFMRSLTSVRVECNFTSASQCAPTPTVSSDSTSFLKSVAIYMYSSNFSDCCSSLGASGPVFVGAVNARDITISHGHSASGLYSTYTYTIDMACIICPDVTFFVFCWTKVNSQIKNSAVFVVNENKVTNYQTIFSNCYGNFSIDGVTSTDFNIILKEVLCDNIQECSMNCLLMSRNLLIMILSLSHLSSTL